MYHRVNDQKRDHHLLCIHPDSFRQQISYLKDNFEIVPLATWNRPRTSRKTQVVITFDDGYADNLYQALPILEEFEAPFCLFVCTGPVEKQIELPTDRFDRVLDAVISDRLEQEVCPEWFLAGYTDLEQNRLKLHQRFYRLSPYQREELLLPLETRLNISGQAREEYRPMTITELQKLASHPLAAIGSHTESHPCLASLSFADQKREISVARAKLQEWLGKSVDTFAYPYGKQIDYNSDTIQVCREEKIEWAVTTRIGQLSRGGHPLELPRFPLRNWSLVMFRRILAAYRWA